MNGWNQWNKDTASIALLCKAYLPVADWIQLLYFVNDKCWALNFINTQDKGHLMWLDVKYHKILVYLCTHPWNSVYVNQLKELPLAYWMYNMNMFLSQYGSYNSTKPTSSSG